MQKQKVIKETTKVAASYFKEIVVKLSKLCKKVGFDKIRTPECFTIHFKKTSQPKLSKQWIRNFQIIFH